MMKVRASNDIGPTMPASSAAPSRTVAVSNNVCVAIITFLRSMISASVPAASPKRSEGAVLALWTNATMSAEGVSVAISHAATVACMVYPSAVPMEPT